MEARNKNLCEQLWNEYSPWLYRICRQLLIDCPDDVDDVVSNTYLAFCETLSKGVEIEYPKAWLYGTLYNFIKMKFRDLNKARKKCVTFSAEDIELGYEPDMIDEILRVKDEEKVKSHILAKLSEKERELYTYVYESELSMQEIAERTGSTKTAVKQNNYRLTKKLKDLVKEENKNL